jgi:regulatory protein YycH of two-component signal transduction system YycFG|tara:strand:+ start:615 stop:917 length:303 start_codon:yes stop_codon:yes gene_type:complete
MENIFLTVTNIFLTVLVIIAIVMALYYSVKFLNKVNEIKDISNNNNKKIKNHIECQKRKMCKIQNEDYEICKGSDINKNLPTCRNVKKCNIIGNTEGCSV